MPTTKYFKNRMITKYALIIKEYFDLMNKSSIIKNVNNPNPRLYIGMNTIHRVFEYVLVKLSSIDQAYYYSQKCCLYYLEYMEQVFKSDLFHNLNHLDAVMFVYKKTIFDIYDGEPNDSVNSIRNIMSLTDEVVSHEEFEIRDLFHNISKFTKILFFWDNINITFENRVKICDEYFHRFLCRSDAIENVQSHLEIIQQKISMNYEKYFDLLKEVLSLIEKTKKIAIKECDRDEWVLMKFYVEEKILFEKFNNDTTTKDLVKWLFVS